MVFLRSVIATHMIYVGINRAHKEMISRVLRAPINLFYDVTPSGLIINRFSNDLGAIEGIVMAMMWAHCCFYGVLSVVAIIAWANWTMLIIVPFVLSYLIYIFKFTIKSYREMHRLQSVMKSPILTHLSESYAGNSTIRAFNARDQFHDRNYKGINELLLCYQITTGTFVWYSTQMNMISIVMLAVSTALCIVLRDFIDTVVLALVFQYTLSLHGSMIGLFHTFSDVEKQMVQIKRCF